MSSLLDLETTAKKQEYPEKTGLSLTKTIETKVQNTQITEITLNIFWTDLDTVLHFNIFKKHLTNYYILFNYTCIYKRFN
jgi:hypothetical protein